MYKVIAVSKDVITRTGISHFVFWEKHDYSIVGVAANYSEMIELIQQRQPDLIVADIDGKCINSKALMGIVREQDGICAVIGIGEGNDPKRIEDALNEGLFDYIEREAINIPDFIERLGYYRKTIFEKKRETENNNIIHKKVKLAAQSQILKELLYGRIRKEELDQGILNIYDIVFPYSYFAVFVIKLDVNQEMIDRETLLFFTEQIIEKEVIFICNSSLGELSFIYNFRMFNEIKQADAIKQMGKKIISILSNKYEVFSDILVSSVYEGVESVSLAYRECCDLAKSKQKNANDLDMQNTNRENNIYIYKMKEYVKENYNKPINMKTVAEEIGLTSSYMSTLFKKNTGETYKDYLINYRLEKAKELLSKTTVQVTLISKEVGYDNEHYFSRIFKLKTGYTPSQYRAIHYHK